jgi:hypothetical protein
MLALTDIELLVIFQSLTLKTTPQVLPLEFARGYNRPVKDHELVEWFTPF